MNLTKLFLLISLIFCSNLVNAVRKNRSKKRSFSMSELKNKERITLDAMRMLLEAQAMEVPLWDEKNFLYRLKDANDNLAKYLKKSKYLPKNLKRKYKTEIEVWKLGTANCKEVIAHNSNALIEKEKELIAAFETKTEIEL